MDAQLLTPMIIQIAESLVFRGANKKKFFADLNKN
jgi:hypothetical protein